MRHFRLSLLLLLAACLSLTQTPALAQEPIARVSSFVGEVFVRSAVTPPAGEWRRLTAAPAPLFNGDEVRTERGRAEVLYPNDDAVRILENSTARFTVSQEQRRRLAFFRRMVNFRAVSTTAGKMWANVKTDRNNEMEFRSPVAVASIRGTILEWQYDPGAGVAFLGIAQGNGLLTALGVSVNVGANRGVTVAQGQPPSAPFAYTPDAPPAISEAAMAAALAAPPAAPVPAPPVAVAPPAPVSAVVAAAPAAPSGGGGAIAPAPAPAPAPTGIAPGTTPAYTGFVSGSFPGVISTCDDCFISVPFTGGFTFPFYGQTYTSAFVGSNGYITFNSGSSGYNVPIQDLFRGEVSGTPRPTIAAFEGDLYPGGGGTVNVTQFTNSFVVTFRNVQNCCNPPGINTFRASLYSNGQIKVEYNNTIDSGEGIPEIGVSPGGANALLNPVNFSSGSITGFGPNDAIFQTFNNPTGPEGVTPRAISYATLSHLSGPSAPGFRTTTIVQKYPTSGTTFESNTYLGTSPVSGTPFSFYVSSGSFSLTYPSTAQSGFSSFSTATNILSITSIFSDTIAAGEFKFAAGQNISVAITDRPVLDLLNATLIFTPNAVGGYDVAYIPTAPVIPASPSS